MVSRFRRSLSFPNPNPNRRSPPKKALHVRSTSLPCRSHPLISQLNDEIAELRIWESKADDRTAAWLCDGLSQLKNLLYSLDDLLQLPQTRESLRRRPRWVETLLDDCLRFVDVYGIFRASLLALKDEQLAAQVAIRRKDESKFALFVKAQKKRNKQMVQLASVVRTTGRSFLPGSESVSDVDIELAAILRDVNRVTVSVSVALFNGISSSSTSSKCWLGWKSLKSTKKIKAEGGIEEFQQVGVDGLYRLRKKEDEELRGALTRLQALEDCIGEIESGSERVFRSLISTRVSLLNILTHQM